LGTENFHASVQYNDMTGTAAADRHDNRSMERYLAQQGLIQDGEFLIGVEMWSGEVHGETQDKPVYVTALVTNAETFEIAKAEIQSGKPLHVRKIKFDMKLNEFFGLFKRFAIAISSDGLLDHREITYDE